MVKISIIVPVYNAGEHFRKCLDTLVNQTLQEIEIILVLDCPTDGSDKVAYEYAARDNRIKVIKNEVNLHIGLSRNKGLDYASGEFVGFSDHDDYRSLDMYEKLFNTAKLTGSSIVASGYGTDKVEQISKIYYPIESQFINKDFMIKLLVGGYNVNEEWNFFILNGGMWNKIYKRSMLEYSKIRFVDNRKTTYEDLLFLTECCIETNTIALVNEVFYYHKEEIGNTSSLYFFNDFRLVKNYILTLQKILKDNNLFERYKKDFYKTVVNMGLIATNNELKSKNKIAHKISNLIKFRKNNFVKYGFSMMSGRDVIYPPKNISSMILRELIFQFYKF